MKPNAWIKSQVARRVGVAPQSVEDRIVAGKLEVFELWGTQMIPERSVRKWERERAKRRALQAQLALREG